MAPAEWKQWHRLWVSCRDCGYLTPSPVSLSWFGTDSVSKFLGRPGTWTKAPLLSDYHCFQPIVTFLSGFRSAELRKKWFIGHSGGWAQVCENQKLIIYILRGRAVIITDHQESWMSWQCVSPDRRCNATLLWHMTFIAARHSAALLNKR